MKSTFASRWVLLLLVSTFIISTVVGQTTINTRVYDWKSDDVMFSGAGVVLSDHQLKGHTIRGGRRRTFNHAAGGEELFFIIKYGPVEVTLNGNTRRLDKGSVVFVLPGDAVVFRNVRRDDAEIYEMRMNSARRDETGGRAAGPSFMLDWYDMSFRAHDRGGVRQLFDRKTVTMQRFDIHITQLNPGLASHPPHTHRNEEIILMIDGDGEMMLDGARHSITTGAAAWVGSNIPHNITNMGKRPALYFAIQWN